MAGTTSQTRDDQTDRFFQPGTALNRVLLEAPYLPRCSNDKTATRIRPREYAIRYPYMQVNRPGMVSWLIFDLDHANALIWEDAGLPAPNLIVRNRQSGHSHLYYAIPPVCTTENARSKPIAYMKAVYEAFAARLDADTDFHSGPVAKTPGHPWWLTWELHNHVYELGKLADYVELAVSPPWGKGPQLDEVSHSRHCILFEHLRHYAYSIVNREREKGSFMSFTRLLEAYAHHRNSFQKLGFSADLPLSSLRATVKSIARWTWNHYRGDSRCHRGVMQLDKDLPLAERQRLAAARTHEVRQQATASKVRAAWHQLQQKGEALTHAAIARVAGLSRQTVAAYKHILTEVLKPAVAAVLEAAAAPTSDVKYGVYQIPAPCGEVLPKAAPLPVLGFLPSFVLSTEHTRPSFDPQDRSLASASKIFRADPPQNPPPPAMTAPAGPAPNPRSFPPGHLAELRALPVPTALDRLGLYWKLDPAYKPRNEDSTRLHVTLPGGFQAELIITGSKWYDSRARQGGAGAIDLVMHLMRISFVDAVKALTSRGAV